MAASRKKSRPGADRRGAKASGRAASERMVENMRQIWLAGMGAIARAQKGGPAAFHDAVSEGLGLLNRSRETAEKMMRDVLGTAQSTVQTRLDSARDQATETWDNFEALFQSRVRQALGQIGVPTASEVRLLTRRVAELNDSVKALSAQRPAPGPKAKAARARAAGRAGSPRRSGPAAGRGGRRRKST